MNSQPVQFLDTSGETSVCQRCKAKTAILVSRKEKFCRNCFIRFIRGKQRKQMQDEKYKVKYGPFVEKLGVQRTLLALSGGASSLALLDVMASLLQEQFEAHKGKQGFELIILNLDEFQLNSLNKHIKDILPNLLELYKPVNIKYEILSLDSYVLDQQMLQRITLNKNFTGFSEKSSKETNYSLDEVLKLCPNKSSMEDLLTIIYDELILRTAYLKNCQTILYGHSMTRIANEIISLAVKGRGSSIYKTISDHSVQFRNKEFHILFPLRDVLFAEISTYVELTQLKKFQLESTVTKSKITKNMTIRDLTTQYFAQLDATGYASTASTVVKTGEKLGAPKFDEVLTTCQICGIEIHLDPKDWLRRITVNQPAALETDEEKDYARLYKEKYGDDSYFNVLKQPINMCYGCTVTLSGINPDSGFIWPVKNTDIDEDREILNKYILSDEED